MFGFFELSSFASSREDEDAPDAPDADAETRDDDAKADGVHAKVGTVVRRFQDVYDQAEARMSAAQMVFERAATEAGVSEGIRSKAAVGGERGDLGQSRARVGMASSARTHVSSFPSTPVDEPGGSPPLRSGDSALRELGGARRRSERHRAHAEMPSSSANASMVHP